MQFILRPARWEDLEAIMGVMHSAMAAIPEPDWFVPDDADYMRNHIDGTEGFCLVAQRSDGRLAAYFTVKYAGIAPDALGHYLGMDTAMLNRTAQMDSCCVAPECQGNGLEGQLLLAAQERLRQTSYQHLLATVHPDNKASLFTLLHRGYRIALADARCYGGKRRHILQRDLGVESKESE